MASPESSSTESGENNVPGQPGKDTQKDDKGLEIRHKTAKKQDGEVSKENDGIGSLQGKQDRGADKQHDEQPYVPDTRRFPGVKDTFCALPTPFGQLAPKKK